MYTADRWKLTGSHFLIIAAESRRRAWLPTTRTVQSLVRRRRSQARVMTWVVYLDFAAHALLRLWQRAQRQAEWLGHEKDWRDSAS